MSKRRSVVVAAGAFILASAMPTGPARGAEPTPCSFDVEITVNPGVTTAPSSGTFTSNGETGTMTCNGPVNGRQPTGPGTAGADGRYGTKKAFSCQDNGNGEGDFTFTVPVSGGNERVRDHMTYDHGAFKGGKLFSGNFQGDRYSGTFEAQPLDGDCVSKPVTRFRLMGKGTLR